MEAKLPPGAGLWPSFWLYGIYGTTRPEINIMEDLDRKLMRYIREHNKDPRPIKWKYDDPSRRIRPVPFT